MRAPVMKAIRPIGYVRSSSKTDPSNPRCVIEVFQEYAPGLTGLDQCSHALVVFQMHRAPFNPRKHLIIKPCYDHRFRPVGILALRCAHRPNNLGVSTVKIIEARGNRLTVENLDAHRGTPILDIKPYVSGWDTPRGPVRLATWLRKLDTP